MLEIKEAINIENKNPNSDMDSLNNIKENLINDINEEKEIKSNNKDNDSTEQEEKEEILSNEHLYINNAVNNQNKENKIKEEKFFDESSISSNKTEKIEDIFNTSKLDRESLNNKIKQNISTIDKEKKKYFINKKLLKRIMIVIEIFFGFLLCTCSILLIIILIQEKISHQKIIGVIIEPLIIIISFTGMLPISNITFKKIKCALYIWESALLVPMSFYVKSSINDKYYFFFDLVINIRIGLLVVQIVNYVISLVFKIDI